MENEKLIILGAGLTGLSAGIASKAPIFESKRFPGGICASYYMRPEGGMRINEQPSDGDAYLFERGGGHWIWSKEDAIFNFLDSLVPMKKYQRKSAVYFPDKNIYVPYPIQYHLSYLDPELVKRIISEIMNQPENNLTGTMAEWLKHNFGTILCKLFFYPFHELYTLGLYKKISFSDKYKNPINLQEMIDGAVKKEHKLTGYNLNFSYPIGGLNNLVHRMAELANVRLQKEVISIDPYEKIIYFSDGSKIAYSYLISTIPLNKIMKLTGIKTHIKEDPHISALVVNIGAIAGDNCPDYHWLYVPKTNSGFYRVGFYSNIDPMFLPKNKKNKVSLYVESALPAGYRPNNNEIKRKCNLIIEELQELKFIDEVEVADPTLIDIAYTWSWKGSTWVEESLKTLKENDIFCAGRYALWNNQGMIDSIKAGFMIGSVLGAITRRLV